MLSSTQKELLQSMQQSQVDNNIEQMTPASPLSPVSLKKENVGFEDMVVTKKETPRNVAQERILEIKKTLQQN